MSSITIGTELYFSKVYGAHIQYTAYIYCKVVKETPKFWINQFDQKISKSTLEEYGGFNSGRKWYVLDEDAKKSIEEQTQKEAAKKLSLDNNKMVASKVKNFLDRNLYKEDIMAELYDRIKDLL